MKTEWTLREKTRAIIRFLEKMKKKKRKKIIFKSYKSPYHFLMLESVENLAEHSSLPSLSGTLFHALQFHHLRTRLEGGSEGGGGGTIVTKKLWRIPTPRVSATDKRDSPLPVRPRVSLYSRRPFPFCPVCCVYVISMVHGNLLRKKRKESGKGKEKKIQLF